jgi:tetraacyldisaccharide 4'-kinase
MQNDPTTMNTHNKTASSGKRKQVLREQRLKSIWYGQQQPSLALRLAATVFDRLRALRHWLYQSGLLKTYRPRVPVIVVGNITVGGTGKTPFVIWLVESLKAQGYRPGVISRGYGGERKVEPMTVTPNTSAHASGDEALLIAKRTGVPVVVDKKRARAARKLVADNPVNIIVSDDGLQHYALARDVEIALVDSQLQLGNGYLLPAGPLREPKERLNTVDMIICKGECDGGNFFEARLQGEAWNLAHPGQRKQLVEFIGQPVNAMAGIAQPEYFFRLLAEKGVAAYKLPLADHENLSAEHFVLDNEYPVLITEKDAVKCQTLEGPWKENVWVVPMSLHVPEKTAQAVWHCLSDKLQLKPHSKEQTHG